MKTTPLFFVLIGVEVVVPVSKYRFNWLPSCLGVIPNLFSKVTKYTELCLFALVSKVAKLEKILGLLSWRRYLFPKEKNGIDEWNTGTVACLQFWSL